MEKKKQEARAVIASYWARSALSRKTSRKQLRVLVHQLELVLFERMNIKKLKTNGMPKYLPQNKLSTLLRCTSAERMKANRKKRVVLSTDNIRLMGRTALRYSPGVCEVLHPKPGFTFAFRIPEVQLADHTFETREIATVTEEILLTLGISGAKTNIGYRRLRKPRQKLKTSENLLPKPTKPNVPVGKPEPTPRSH
ncbi:MAG: hypothetical protein H6558_15540 [Lewinellaceae bacterium]|nr:hypothetical protein [Lewinellaceae bacterium]